MDYQSSEQQQQVFNSDYISELTNIRDSIEAMTKFNQVEILRIFVKHSVTIN